MTGQLKVSAYLAHPTLSRKKIREWELNVESKYNIDLVNPFYDLEDDSVEAVNIQKMDKGEDMIMPFGYSESIVWRDLTQIINTDFVIAILDENISYGTAMEMFFAKQVGKPVYLICTNKYNTHPWLRFCANYVFNNFKEFETFLEMHKLVNFQELKWVNK